MSIAVGLLLAWGTLAEQPPARMPPAPPDTVVVGLEDMLRTALEQNLRFRAASAATRGAETYHRTAWARFDPTVSVGAEHNEYDGNGVGAQLFGELPTGATYLVGSVAPSARPDDPLYADAIVARIDQPVLRGLGLYSARSAIRAADEGVAASRASLRRTRAELAAGVRLAYARLVERHRQEASANRSVERAEELLEAYTSLFEIERITEVDLITAKLGVASRKTVRLQVRRERRDAEDALLFAVYGADAHAVLADVGDATWFPGDTVVVPPDPSTIEDALVRAIAARPDLQAARHDVARARYRSRYARNAALPTLNLFASFSSTSAGDLPGSGDLLTDRFEEWRFGVLLSRPVWNGSASAERDRAAAATERTEAQLLEAENVVRQDVRAAVRDIALAREQVTIAADASQLAREQFGMERERLRLGLTDIFRVLQYEEQVGIMERAEAEAWLSYVTAVVQYRLAMGED